MPLSLADNSPQFWAPIQPIRDHLSERFKSQPVLEIGPDQIPLECSTHFIDCADDTTHPETSRVDIDVDRFPYTDKQFELVYARHVLEDIQNPDHAFAEMVRVARNGHIETPSPIAECSLGMESPAFRGYIHHRYIVWTEIDTHTLCFLPKYPIIEHILFDSINTDALNSPLYWNNYYEWSYTQPPKIRVYKNGVNFNIIEEYCYLLNTAMEQSFQHTHKLGLSLLNEKNSLFNVCFRILKNSTNIHTIQGCFHVVLFDCMFPVRPDCYR
jgi:hypothetical protein